MPARRIARPGVSALCVLLLVCGVLVEPDARADDALRARYGAALRDSIQQAWIMPDGAPADARCRLLIQQLPGGEVVAVEVLPDCSFDVAARQSLLRAVQRAAPLPYVGFERVFSRSLTVTFTSPAR